MATAEGTAEGPLALAGPAAAVSLALAISAAESPALVIHAAEVSLADHAVV